MSEVTATVAVAETVEQQIARLTAENAALKANASKTRSGKLTLKVSAKGAISVYGMGRFPTTLYKRQWLKLLEGCSGGFADTLREFITANEHLLAKDEE